MSSKLKLKATAGGSLSLSVDDALATDIEVEIPTSGIRPLAPVVLSGQMGTAQTSPTAPTALAFNEFWSDIGGITHSGGLFTVPVAGTYRITGSFFGNNSGGPHRILVGINNTTPTKINHRGHSYASVGYMMMPVNSIVDLQGGDTITFYLEIGQIYNISTDKFNQFGIELIGEVL